MRSAVVPTPQRIARRELLLGAFTMLMAVVGLAAFGAASLGGGISLRGTGARAVADAGPRLVAIGTGRAAAPAAVADLQLLIGASMYDGQIVIGDGPTDAPAGDAERAAVAPIVAALTAAGAAAADVRVLVSPALTDRYFGAAGATNGVRIDVTVRDPTAEGLNALINAASRAAIAEGKALSQIGVAYTADCGPIERQARQLAIEQARVNASQQAELLGMPLGELVLSSDVAPQIATGAIGAADCRLVGAPRAVQVGEAGAVTLPPFDPAAPAEAWVGVQVSLTFALPDA